MSLYISRIILCQQDFYNKFYIGGRLLLILI